MRDIVEVLGVGGDLLEQSPSSFERGQVLLALMFSPARMNQIVLPPDAVNGHVAEGEIPFAFQALGSEGGQLATQRHHLRFELTLNLVRTGVGGARAFFESLDALLGMSTHPLADSAQSGVELPSSGLQAVRTGVVNQAKTMVKGFLHFADLVVIGVGAHGRPILLAPRCLGPPPPRQPPPSSSSHLYTSTPQGGYHVPFQSQMEFKFDFVLSAT